MERAKRNDDEARSQRHIDSTTHDRIDDDVVQRTRQHLSCTSVSWCGTVARRAAQLKEELFDQWREVRSVRNRTHTRERAVMRHKRKEFIPRGEVREQGIA